MAGLLSAQGAAPKRKAQPAVDINALLAEARAAFERCDVPTADGLLDKCDEALDARKKADPAARAAVEALRDSMDQLRTMLDRVESIVIIDSIAVPRSAVADLYRLNASAGSLRTDDRLPAQWDAAPGSTAYVTESGKTVLYAATDTAGQLRLMEASLLGDGKWDTPLPLDDSLGDGGDANYPWLMSDGTTLYFAANGPESLGGYDIFISRRNDDGGFYKPQNVGLPYNSPYDDYLLAIDEEAGTGWWATDRNQLGDSVTVYRFITSEMRRNVPSDDPKLVARARIDSWRDTQEPGADYSKWLALPEETAEQTAKPEFRIALPDGRILTRFDQLSTSAARGLVRELIALDAETAQERRRLELMRLNWRRGSSGDDIQAAEQRLAAQRNARKQLLNRIIKSEGLR